MDDQERKMRATTILNNYQLLMKYALANDQVSEHTLSGGWPPGNRATVCTSDQDLLPESRCRGFTGSNYQKLVQSSQLVSLINGKIVLAVE